MALSRSKTLCSTCSEQRDMCNCKGCGAEFCFTHLQEHREVLGRELSTIIKDYDRFKDGLAEQKHDTRRSTLIEQIDQWEERAIEKIRHAAQECRETVLKHTDKTGDDIDEKLRQFTEQLRTTLEENKYHEIDLERLRKKLRELAREHPTQADLSLHQDTKTLVYKIYVSASSTGAKSLKWKQRGTTVAGGNGEGHQLNQLHCPLGISIAPDKSLVIADYDNHRIVRWEPQAKAGTITGGGKGQGNRTDQLCYPTDVLLDKASKSLVIADQGNQRVVRWFHQNPNSQQIVIEKVDCCGLAMDKNGFLYVSDIEKHEVRRWKQGENKGTVVVGGNGRGNKLNQLSRPSYLFVDEQQTVYVSDWENHRVMKWKKGAKEGVVVAGGNGEGHRLNQLSQPQSVLVDQFGDIYVSDGGNHRVVRWKEGDDEGELVVGGNGKGKDSNQLHGPTALAFDEDESLYVADYGNSRVQKFDLILE